MNEFEIESDEGGFTLVVAAASGEVHRFGISDPEALYDSVKAEIGPWLRERDAARNEYVVAVREGGSLRIEPDEDAYDPTDPKHPRFHSLQSERWDSREGK